MQRAAGRRQQRRRAWAAYVLFRYAMQQQRTGRADGQRRANEIKAAKGGCEAKTSCRRVQLQLVDLEGALQPRFASASTTLAASRALLILSAESASLPLPLCLKGVGVTI